MIMNRVFKIVATTEYWKKKRIYTQLENFNKFWVNNKNKIEWTLYRYNDIYWIVYCFEKIDNKWIEINPLIWEDFK